MPNDINNDAKAPCASLEHSSAAQAKAPCASIGFYDLEDGGVEIVVSANGLDSPAKQLCMFSVQHLESLEGFPQLTRIVT